MDLTQWRRHIDHVIGEEGQWVGLLDEDGVPILDFPAIVSINATETHLDASSVEIEVSVADDGAARLMEELVADGLGVLDEEKRLVPAAGPTRLVCVARPGERLVYTVTHTVAEGGLLPTKLTVHGVDLLDSLAWWPCPSIPTNWQAGEFKVWKTDASGATYVWPRQLATVELATKADGYTVKGPARDTIRTIIQDSFDAANTLMGWKDPHAWVDYGGLADTSLEILIRTDDSSIWDTISEPALHAGISIEVELWWPGDPGVKTRNRDRKTFTTRSWDYPVQIVRVTAPGRG